MSSPALIILYMIPALLSVMIALAFLSLKLNRMSREVKEYREDKFRHQLEAKIEALGMDLAASKERFEQLNHLILKSQLEGASIQEKEKAIGPGANAFFEALGIDLHMKVDKELIFVLMPFRPDFDETFRVIKDVVESAGFRCMRGDEEKISGSILPHILWLVAKARLIIAEITGRNANVFYELGISHAIGKQVLLISKTAEDMPFDISGLRILTYQDSKDLTHKLKDWLIRTFAKME